MGLLGKPANLGESLSSFKKEVSTEIASNKRMLKELQTPTSNDKYGYLISIGLVLLAAFLIFQQNSVFILWLIIAILFYSYNFIIFFIPTTIESIRPDDDDVAPILIKERKWFAIRLLIKKRKLAIEIGLTVLLGGILPLALSFSIIFGLGMAFALYFGFFTNIIAPETIDFIVIQITLIILFYVMMLIIKPQAQGITKIGRTFRRKLDKARSKGKAAHLVVVLTMIGGSCIAGVLVFGAMLLPGFLLPSLWADLNRFSTIDIPMIVLIFFIQLVVMRHFQGIISRRMAIKRLKNRLLDLNQDVLAKLDSLASLRESDKKEAILEDLKSKYYSIAIYDLIEQDIFGYSRIYLFGIRMRYMLDEDVLNHINVAPENGGAPKKEPKNTELKNVELKTVEFEKLFLNMDAELYKWKFSMEETEEGTRLEIHAIALIKKHNNE